MTNIQIILVSLLLILCVGLLGLLVYFYNKFVALHKNVSLAFANIDLIIKQRHDELPKIIEVCRVYMNYENKVLQNIVNLRNKLLKASDKKQIGALGQLESSLQKQIGHLFALSENYPNLKASQSFIQLQTRISHLESAIKSQREIYNQNVTNKNIAIALFPANMFAKLLGYSEATLLEFIDTDLEDINLKQELVFY